jgi:two-component system KDP operon response regulator KdpE
MSVPRSPELDAISGENAPSRQSVLIVEDAPDLRFALTATLIDTGDSVSVADRGDSALRESYSGQPDLVLLDLGLPGLTGLEVCDSIRTLSDVPVIIFTTTTDVAEKLDAFDRGADDYIVKGTEMAEIVARVGPALRRSSSVKDDAPEPYSDPALHLDITSRTATVRGCVAELTRTEYELLAALVKRVGQPIPASQLLQSVWGPEYDSEELVKWHIGRLRKKIEEDSEIPRLIVTRRGFGYMYMRPGR